MREERLCISLLIEGYLDIVKTLVEAGAHIDIRDEKGRTPLRSAFSKNYYRHSEADRFGVISYLVERGASPDDIDMKKRLSASEYAQIEKTIAEHSDDSGGFIKSLFKMAFRHK